MANGFHGSKAEWAKLIAPLEKLDPILEEFAKTRRLAFTKNEKNAPNRRFEWGFPVKRIIEIYSDGTADNCWTLWVCAAQMRPDGYCWKKYTLKSKASIDEMEQSLQNLLDAAHALVTSWSEDDLEVVKR